MSDYIALLRKEKGTRYGVDFPDFPGCITGGRTLEEARRNASEALRFHIEGMLEDGEPIPEPSPLDAVMADPFNRDAAVLIVSAPTIRSRAVRVNITIDKDLLRRIDALGGRGSRSRLLAEGVRLLLKRSDRAAASAPAMRAAAVMTRRLRARARQRTSARTKRR